MSRRFRIALAQCESVIGSQDFDPRPVNLARLERAVQEAADEGAQLVLFGEMFVTGYRTDQFHSLWAARLDAGDPTVASLTATAARYGVHIMVGTATHSETAPGVVHNTAVLVSGDGLLNSYHKLHAARLVSPSGEEVNEFAYFSPGSQAPVWQTELGVFGPQICYDSSFPELSRTQSLKGAEVMLNITASATGFESQWEHLRAARAFENSGWYVACSVVGVQNGDRFFGRSAVIDPLGNTVAEGKDGDEDLVIADIDPDETVCWRSRMNTMSARRPDAYGEVMNVTDRKEI
ncbi:MAG: Nitrilase/cyanide hydratase and apolipoprotein N-acyltransferase [Pseudonocardiales bacterium]|nr:Nitrilase/cyanide hydratase and apolipoprotein N-acyltransferase [Pseudonocardiales bacterium]